MPSPSPRPTPGPATAPDRARTRTSALTLALAWALLPWLDPVTASAATPPAGPQVVIHEIMYHPPDDRDELQWVELHNPGTQPVDLAGWSFTKGIQFRFTNSLPLPPGGFLVVARDLGAFRIRYGTNPAVVGEFGGRLSHSGERLELSDAQRRVVDAVEYSDSHPWPISPDGMSPSLERRLPSASGLDPANWAPSPLPQLQAAAGTPGQPNAARTTNLPPNLRAIRFPETTPAEPQATEVQAVLADPDGLGTVTLHVASLPVLAPAAPTDPAARTGNPASTLTLTLTMTRVAGDALQGTYTATIPPQPPGHVVRFHLECTDLAGSKALHPHPHDARPTWSLLSSAPTNNALVPFAFLAQHGPAERPGSSLRTINWSRPPGRRNANTQGEPTRGNATFVHIPAGTSTPRVFDHVRITPRQSGWKIRLNRDQSLDAMSTINLIFEAQPRYVLAEHLAYEAYRRTSVPTPQSGHWRAWMNGRPLGYHLFVEQPNSAFLRRVGRNTDGDLFKLIWYGGDLIGQHEKKNNPDTGHASLVETVEALNQARGAAAWAEIERRFNVPGFVDYYAVNMVIQNWDGFFNNYFLYRSPGPEGRWEIIPWDEDKTWGDHDGASAQYDWYTMPLNFGMSGSRPQQTLRQRFSSPSGPHGGPMWWRNPGWFSGPLLANPEFRAHFKTRLRELLNTQFTPEAMEPVIARLHETLAPEIRYRAGLGPSSRGGQRPPSNPSPDQTAAAETAAMERFERHIDSFRRQVRFRREFLLQELDREKSP